MKKILFLVLALPVIFLAAASTDLIIFGIVAPLVKTFPAIRVTALGPVLRAAIWSAPLLGAACVAFFGYRLIGAKTIFREVLLYAALLFLATAFAWPAGNILLVLRTGGWSEVLSFSLYLWWDVFFYRTIIFFNIILWQEAIVFYFSSVLLFYLSVKTYGRAQ